MTTTKGKVKAPSIKAVRQQLFRIQRTVEFDDKEPWCDVRLQVYPDGAWYVRFGPSDYDQDHRGWWGASSIGKRGGCESVARDLIEQVRDSIAQGVGNG